MWRILLIFFIPFQLFSQEPGHNIIGSEELEDDVVYSMIQDERANIWLSTNNGILKYDGYEFHEIPIKGVMNIALFGLTTDHKNNIYCYNTSGQVFTIKNDSLYLYYTLPDSLFRNFYYIEFDNLNNLVVSGNDIYSIQEGNIRTLIDQSSFHEFPIIKKKDGSLEFYSSLENDLYRFKDNQITRQHVNIDFGEFGFYYPIDSENAEYLGVGRSSQLYKRRGSQYEKIDIGFEKQTGCWVFADRQDDIWILSNQRGVYLHTQNKKNSRFSNKLLFPSYTFSCKLEDRDGNIWLGTFGKGLIQISNKEDQLISNESLPENNALKCISQNKNGDLIIGSLNGTLFEYKNDVLNQLERFPTRIDRIEYNEFRNDFYFNHFEYNIEDSEIEHTKFGSVRNISTTNDSIAIITAYTGVFIKDYSSAQKLSQQFEKFGFTNEDESGYHLKASRSNCATYDSKTNTFWLGGTSMLRQFSENGEVDFKFENESIIALNMLWVNDELYITTIGKGILILHNNKVVRTLNEENGLISNTIGKIIRRGDKLYFGTKHGLQEFDLNSGKFRSFKNANGLQLKVKDFTVKNNVAYIVHTKGLQTIRLNSKLQKFHPPILDFTSVLVDKIERKHDSNLLLDHTQNNILFKFAAKTYKNREQLTYKYQILGIDTTWETLPSNENFIRLNGLDYGDYTLSLYGIDASGQKSNMIQYSFSIPQPFWMAWWFYTILVIITFSSVILFFRRRLRIQQIKADQINELNASKLTAIQSQMNPHFIFNSLNSIQDLVIQGDKENSYRFITKFANLVRKTLKYSDKDFVEFDQEVQLLELYLSLEKLRFKTDFEYVIDTNNIADIMIPPMLIQPFIENALLHGLLHKEGLKKLHINFEQEDNLICTITDNGVGREKAKEIKERQKSKHESFAVQAIKKRLTILEERFDSSIGFEYFDITENGQATGTKVVIKMPIERLF